MRRLLLLSLLCALPASAANYTVKAGGGGNYTTIQACATAMANGDTCTVFAGTYNEYPTLAVGGVGNYKTITVNGSDVVTVQGFTLANHTKVIGNCPALQGTVTTATCGFFITNPSSLTTLCVSIPSGSTDIVLKSNVMYACGGIGEGTGSASSSIYIQNNTFSYACSTTSTLNTCTGVTIYGDNQLIENNDLSHNSDFFHFYGNHNVVRNNSMHDSLASECGSNSGNCHIDAIESEPVLRTQYNLYEGNTLTNNVGANGHGYLTQGDACSGNCFNLIFRFNVGAHVGAGGIIDDNAASAVNPGYFNVKSYNNTWVDFMNTGSTYGSQNTFSHNSTGGSQINELFYYPFAITDSNAYSTDSSTVGTFSVRNNLAWCTSGSCSGLHGKTYGSGSFTGDPGNVIANPQFSNYAANDFHLTAGSPAIATGSYLTTANGSGSTSTTLIVNDASYFQDGTQGLTGVQADCISVTTAANPVCITAVNYSTNTLTLASAMTWSSGASIYLRSKSDGAIILNAAGPDIGAYQFVPAGTGGRVSFTGNITITGGVTFGNVYGPPNYLAASLSTANPGAITAPFTSHSPSAVVTTSNGAISPCTANCMQYVSGTDTFNTGWQTGNGGGNGGNIMLGGGTGTVTVSGGGYAVAWVSGTQFQPGSVPATFFITMYDASTGAAVVYPIASTNSATSITLATAAPTGTSSYSIVGNKFGVSAWNASTVATLMAAPGTQTGVSMSNFTACAGTGCAGATGYDSSIPGYVAGTECMGVITDGSSTPAGKSTANFTATGGGDMEAVSMVQGDGSYWVGVVHAGGVAYFYNVKIVGGCPVPTTTGVSGLPAQAGTFTWSHVTPNVFYVQDTTSTYNTAINKCTITSLTSVSCSLRFDPFVGGGSSAGQPCPGVTPFVATDGPGNFHTDATDTTFGMEWGTGGQGTSYWLFTYNVSTGQCTSTNFVTNNVYDWCASSCGPSTPPLGTLSGAAACFSAPGSAHGGNENFHDVTYSPGGGFIVISLQSGTGYWGGGACAGNTNSTQVIVYVPGSLTNTYLDTSSTYFRIGSHYTTGISTLFNPNANPTFNFRALSSPTTFTAFAVGPSQPDNHPSSMPHYVAGTGALPNDLGAYIVTSDSAASATAPLWGNNVIGIYYPQATYPPGLYKVVTHTYSGNPVGSSYGHLADGIGDGFGPGNAIGSCSMDGILCFWGSTGLHQFGIDGTGAPRSNVLAVVMQ